MQTSLQLVACMTDRALVQYSPERVNLPPDVLEKLIQVGSTKPYKKGALIHQEGDATETMCLVQSGRISGFRQNPHGKLGAAFVVGEGVVFGLFPLLMQRPRSHNCEALEDCTLVHIERAQIWKLIEEDPDVRRCIFNCLCDRLSLAYDVLEEERYLSLPKRLAKRLLNFADAQGVVPLTQHILAEQLGVSRVSLGKALKHLKSLGFVESGYGEIRVIEAAGLLNWVESTAQKPRALKDLRT